MARKIKKGSYWRTLNSPYVYKAIEEGWSHQPSYFHRTKDNWVTIEVLQVKPEEALHRLFRCKKNGTFYSAKSSEGQILNRRFLSLRWQAMGALRSLASVQYQAAQLGVSPCIDDRIADLESELLYQLEKARKAAMEQLRAQQAKEVQQ